MNATLNRGTIHDGRKDVQRIMLDKPFRGANREQWENALASAFQCALCEPDVCVQDLEALVAGAMHRAIAVHRTHAKPLSPRKAKLKRAIQQNPRLAPALTMFAPKGP